MGAQVIVDPLALRVEFSPQVGDEVNRAVHRPKVDLQHPAVAREEASAPVLVLDYGVQNAARDRVADQRELRSCLLAL